MKERAASRELYCNSRMKQVEEIDCLVPFSEQDCFLHRHLEHNRRDEDNSSAIGTIVTSPKLDGEQSEDMHRPKHRPEKIYSKIKENNDRLCEFSVSLLPFSDEKLLIRFS